jgi:hypothetical protein
VLRCARKFRLTCLVGQDETGELQLTADDYLLGVIGMVNELVSESLPRKYVSIQSLRPKAKSTLACIQMSVLIGLLLTLQPRLSINAVTAQNFALPVKIAAFVNDIFASYSMVRCHSIRV